MSFFRTENRTANGSPKSPALAPYGPWIFMVCFCVHLATSLAGWNHPLDDYHGFRQCQTAISAYYTVKDGFRLDYETPVLGKPWSTPVEFPLYQWIVAGAVRLLGTPLDQTGRFFSLVFFYLGFFPLFFLLKYLGRDPRDRFFLMAFVLGAPIYLFWSRTFMIESLAWFLSLSYLAACAKTFESKATAFLLAASILGTLAGLVKITTFLGFMFPAFLLMVGFAWNKGGGRLRAQALSRMLIRGVLIFGLPLGAAWSWTKYSDQLKILNPLAAGFLSTNTRWIFGTLDQRLSPSTWREIFDHSHLINLLGSYNPWTIPVPILLVLAFLAMVLSPKRIQLALCFLFFLIPVLVFTNLYFVHDYYFYANDVFFSLLLGLALLSFFEYAKTRFITTVLLGAILALFAVFYSEYLSAYNPLVKTPTLQIVQFIKDHTSEKGVLLINGLDWDPTLPYYSERRALMDSADSPLQSPAFAKALENLGEDKITAMLVAGKMNEALIQERVSYFDFDPTPFYLSFRTNRYYLYVKK